ncbi:MAG: hypothetical protein ACI8RE_003315 [Ilumatobacter sp.]|jgi:hypothetical protein
MEPVVPNDGKVRNSEPAVVALTTLCLIAIAAMLRVGDLGPTSLWVDDAWVAYVDRAAWSDIPAIGLTGIGYLFGLKAWLAILGFSEVAAQLPAFILGVAAPPALYLVLRRRLGGVAAATLALVLATNDVHITYSYHVKQYTFDALWSVACLWFCLRIASDRASVRLHVGFASVAIVAAVISFTTIVETVAAFTAATIAIGWREIRNRRNGAANPLVRGGAISIAAMTVAGLAMVGFQRVVIEPNVTPGIRAYWSDQFVDRTTIRTSFLSLADRFTEVTAVTFSLDPDSTLTKIATVLLFGFIGLGVRRFDPPAVFCAVAVGVAAMLSFLGLAPLGGGRTDLHLLVPLIAGGALGIHSVVGRLDRPLRPLRSAGWAVAGAASLVFVAINPPSPRPYPDNVASDFVAIIDAQRQPTDAILLHRSAFVYGLYTDRPSEPISDNYHYSPAFEDDPLMFRLQWGLGDPAPLRDRLALVGEQSNVMWILSSPMRTPEGLDPVVTILDEFGWTMTDRHVGQEAVLDRWEQLTDNG